MTEKGCCATLRHSIDLMFIISHNLPLLKKHTKFLLFFGLFFAALSLLITLFFPSFYRADAEVLIISTSRYGVDPYTVVKSAERVGENIAQIIRTDDFFAKVMRENNYAFDRTQFDNVNSRVRRKRWTRAIDANVVYGTGILQIGAYGKNPEEASALASAVVDRSEDVV